MSNYTSSMRALEQHWQLHLPETFGRLYRAFDYPFISPCEFLSLDQMLGDTERWRGMLPQFLPIGTDGDENYYGFYLPPGNLSSDHPVLLWDHEYDHYAPVASGFEAFLRWSVIYGRYLAQDAFEEEDPAFEEEEKQRRDFAGMLGLDPVLVTDAIPRNDHELYERLLRSDGQSANALAQLGGMFFGRGDLERARDCFVRASEAAPWFADPYYLLAETYLKEDKKPRACRLWWQMFQMPIALSTRTTNYDLGAEHPEAEIYEEAARHCIECEPHLEAAAQISPLWKLLRADDPFAPRPRLRLAETMERAGDYAGVERELLNALTLATEEAELDEAYERLTAFYECAGRQRDAALCRGDSVRA